jgi:cell division inhibitor SulA
LRQKVGAARGRRLSQEEDQMPKYVIEREIPNAGSFTPEQIVAISQKSCSVLKNLGPQIQWLESYVTPDKIYCVYIAPNEQMVREHAKQGGFPANRVSEVKQVIDPTSAEA